jgi:pentatricopeptide repeat protein
MRYGKAAAVTMLACNRAGAFQTSLDIFNAFRTDADARVTQQANPPHQDTAAGKGGGTAGGSVSSVALAPPSDALQFPLRSLVVFNEAVEAMRREGMVEEAVELVVTMRARFGVPPDHATFGSALAGCREAGEPALVTALLDALFIELEERQREAREDARAVAAGGKRRLWRQPLLPSDALHSELIGCFGRFGEPRRALRLFAQVGRGAGGVEGGWGRFTSAGVGVGPHESSLWVRVV